MIEKDTVILDLDDYNDLIKAQLLLEMIDDKKEETDKICYLSEEKIKELFEIDKDLKVIVR